MGLVLQMSWVIKGRGEQGEGRAGRRDNYL